MSGVRLCKIELELITLSIVSTKNLSQMKLKLKVKGKIAAPNNYNNNRTHSHLRHIHNEVMKYAEKQHITEMLCAYFIVYCSVLVLFFTSSFLDDSCV